MTPHDEHSMSIESSSLKGDHTDHTSVIPSADVPEGRNKEVDSMVVESSTKHSRAPSISFTSVPSSLPDNPVDLLLQLNVELLRIYNEFYRLNLSQTMGVEMQQYSLRIQSNMQWILQHTPSLNAQPQHAYRIPHPIVVSPPSTGLPPSTTNRLDALYAQLSVVFKEHIDREQKRTHRRSMLLAAQNGSMQIGSRTSHSPTHSRSSSLHQTELNEFNKRVRAEEGDATGDGLFTGGQREESPKRKRVNRDSPSGTGHAKRASTSPTSNLMEITTWHTPPSGSSGLQSHRATSVGAGGNRPSTPLRIPTPGLRPGSAQSSRSSSPMPITTSSPHHSRRSMAPPPIPAGPPKVMTSSPSHNPSPTHTSDHNSPHPHQNSSPHTIPPTTASNLNPQSNPSHASPSPLPRPRTMTEAANPLIKLSAAEIQARYLEFRSKLTAEQRARIDSSRQSQSDLDLWNSLGKESASKAATPMAVTQTPPSNDGSSHATNEVLDSSIGTMGTATSGFGSDLLTNHSTDNDSVNVVDFVGSIGAETSESASQANGHDEHQSSHPSTSPAEPTAAAISSSASGTPTTGASPSSGGPTTASIPSSLPPIVVPPQHVPVLLSMVASPEMHPSVQMLRERVQNFDGLTAEKKVQMLWLYQQNKIRLFKAEQEKMREERARLGLPPPFASFRRNGEGSGGENGGQSGVGGNILIRGMPLFPNARDGIFNFGTGVIGPAPFPYGQGHHHPYPYPHARMPSNPMMAPPPVPPPSSSATSSVGSAGTPTAAASVSAAPSPAPSSSGSVTVVGTPPPSSASSRRDSISSMSSSPRSVVSQLGQAPDGGINPAMVMMGHMNPNAAGFPSSQGGPSGGRWTPTPQQLLMQINNPSSGSVSSAPSPSASSAGYQRLASPALSTVSSSATLVGSPYNTLAMLNHQAPPMGRGGMMGIGLGGAGVGAEMQNGVVHSPWSPSAQTFVQGGGFTPGAYQQYPSPAANPALAGIVGGMGIGGEGGGAPYDQMGHQNSTVNWQDLGL
ncbi:hypothetical protein FRC17_004973 [Serendipita sp. 399]|nr:hypothetical protein FRC17_004973 [Serendipita sp. 399]